MATNRPLDGDLTVSGMDQKSMHSWMSNVTDLLNEFIDDHATNKTNMDDLKTLTNDMRTYLTGDRVIDDAIMVLSSNFDVKVGANVVVASIDGSLVTVAAAAAADSGTAATFPTGTWGIMNITTNASASLTATWATDTGTGYSTEALAIAALPAAPSNEVSLGYVTVKAHATGTFLAGTDALKTGTGGDVAAETNYYELVDPMGVITSAVSSSAASTLSDTTAITLLRS